MEIELRALLLNTAAITVLVPAGQINFGTHPQGAPYPAVVLNTISGTEGLVMNGPNGLFEARVQVDCYAVTYGGANLVAEPVAKLLHGYRAGGFRLIQMISQTKSRIGAGNEAERPYRVSMDFNVAWRA